jgi:hypothetical protein
MHHIAPGLVAAAAAVLAAVGTEATAAVAEGAYQPEEAERAFRQAARLDPGLAMPWWGVGLIVGPNINEEPTPGISLPIDAQVTTRYAHVVRSRLAQGCPLRANPCEACLASLTAAQPRVILWRHFSRRICRRHRS